MVYILKRLWCVCCFIYPDIVMSVYTIYERSNGQDINWLDFGNKKKIKALAFKEKFIY